MIPFRRVMWWLCLDNLDFHPHTHILIYGYEDEGWSIYFVDDIIFLCLKKA